MLNDDIGCTLCPNCNCKVKLPFKIIEFYIAFQKLKTVPCINIYRSFTYIKENRDLIDKYCIDAIHNVPFIAKIKFTKPENTVIGEMIKFGLLKQETIDKYNLKF